MHARVLNAVLVLLATATDGAHDPLFQRWLTRGQLPAPCQHAAAAAASRDEALLASALDSAWFKVADDKHDSMYFVEKKQELFLFGEGLAVPASITTPRTTTDTGLANASTRVRARTSTPATTTSVPATSTSAPATSTSAPATSTSVPATSTSAPAVSTSVPATSTSALTTGANESSTSSNTLLPSSTIPQGYTYYPTTGSYYKLYHERYASWNVANTTCAGEGAHLTVLNDAVEADIIARIVSDAAGYYYHGSWTGLRDNRPGGVMQWRTVHGEPLSDVYNVWGDGRPLSDAERTCADFNADDKKLYDTSCDWTRYFTCEISQ